MRVISAVLYALTCVAALAQPPTGVAGSGPSEREAKQAQQLRDELARLPRLPFHPQAFSFQPPSQDWKLGIVSSVRVDTSGLVYVFQRGDQADPILVFDQNGRLVRSWGKGMFQVPHTLRFDPEGNLWAVDAGNSNIIKFSPKGDKLLEIQVGEVPSCSFPIQCGTSDIAFGPGGRIFVSDGYGNARILELSSNGKRVRQWGSAGSGPGQFNLVHGLVIKDRVIYVADRENNRIQRFDLDGRYLGEWAHLGKPFSLQIADGQLWVGSGVPDQTVVRAGQRAPGWLLKVDISTGKILGFLESNRAHHFIEVTPAGELMSGSTPDGFAWFRR